MEREEEEEVHLEIIEVRDEEKEQRTQLIGKLENFSLDEENPKKNVQHEHKPEGGAKNINKGPGMRTCEKFCLEAGRHARHQPLDHVSPAEHTPRRETSEHSSPVTSVTHSN